MKNVVVVFTLSVIILFSGCKKDDGLTDADHKEKFLKALGTNAQGVDLKQTDDGGYILLGITQGAGSQDVYLKKVDAFGNAQWSKTYDGPAGGKDEDVAGIELLPSGGYVIAGTTILDMPIDTTDSTSLTIPLSSSFLLIIDEAGNEPLPFWLTYNSGKIEPVIEKEDEQCFGIEVIPSGNILIVSEKRVVKSATGEFKSSYARTIDGSSFALLEVSEIDNNTSGSGASVGFRDVVYTTDGQIVATGFTDLPGPNASGNSLLLSVLDDLNNVFTKNLAYGSTEDNFGLRIKENISGNIICAGYTRVGGRKEMYMIDFPSVNGLTPPFSWEFVGDKAGDQECVDFVEVTDGYILAGYSENNDDRQIYLVKIDQTGGTVLWEREYGFVGFDEAKAIIATSDNGLAVLGSSSDERGNLVMTLLKLDSGGNLR